MMNKSPDNHEAAMARADLYKLANYSMKLFKMIHEGQELEGWVQAKITKAADYVASVYHFMEYEMKSSDYGSKLENSDVYSESVRRAFEQKLMEAKKKADKVKKEADKVEEGWDDMLKAVKDKAGPQPSGGSGVKKGSRYGGSKQKADDVEKDDEDEKPKKNTKVKEAAKPDYLDFDKDGNKKEPMKKALKDKKKNPFAKKVKEDLQSGTSGAQAVRYYSAAVKKLLDVKNSNPKLAAEWNAYSAERDKYDQISPRGLEGSATEDGKMAMSLLKKYGIPIQDPKPASPSMLDRAKGVLGMKEVAMSPAPAQKKSGIPSTATTTVPGMRATPADLKKANSSAALGEGKCNHTAKGKKCPVHGLKECGSMYEAKNLKQQAAIAIAKKKAK